MSKIRVPHVRVNKSPVVSLIALCLLIVLIIVFTLVGKGNDHPTDATADPAATTNVAQEMFEEHLKVDQPIIRIGQELPRLMGECQS